MDSPRTWYPLPTVYTPGPYTVEASGCSPVSGESIPRRTITAKNNLKVVPEPGICTIYDILIRSSKKFGSARALGSRKLIRTYEDVKKGKPKGNGVATEGKKWTFYELSPYHYISFTEYEQMALACGAGLRKLGMEVGDRLHLFAGTTPFWLAMAHGASSQSLPIVTAYDTLGESGVEHSLYQTHARAIFTEVHLLAKLISPLITATEVQIVIYNDNTPFSNDDVSNLQAQHPHLIIYSFSDLQELGKAHPCDPVPPRPDDLCCIMYTSGSTGAPKGVLLKHRNVVAAVAGADAVVGKYLGPGDGLLAYLPLAHIFEFMFENASLYWGCTMGYGSPKTLSDRSMRNSAGDIREFKPTVMVGVPGVWETVKKGIIQQVANSNMIARNLFWGALSVKSMLLANGLPGTAVLDYLVFSKIKAATGGRLRICMNGGGPVAKETLRFISMVITPMIGGYGLTETCGMGAIVDPAAWTDSALGEMPASIEIKLVDVADLGYRTNTTQPQGEIWIRGGAVTEGYLDLPEENADSFHNGWFKTGDIGEFDSDGRLRVIDRKKNLVKTLNGEYIALEKLETIYRSSDLVLNICIYADPSRNKPIAIVVPVEKTLESLASQHGISGETLEDFSSNSNLCDMMLHEIQQVSKHGGLNGIEIVDSLIIATEEWTAQNGLTTSAQKLNRKAILAKYQKDIDRVLKTSA